MRLDFNEPYGTIFGKGPHPGARYSQGGRFFNIDGEQVSPEPEPIQADSLVEAATRLKESGLTDTEIGDRLGVSRQKITKVLSTANDSQPA